MVKGLLLVDQKMNTVIVPMDDDNLQEWMKYKIKMYRVHQHKTLKELDADVRNYLRNKYEEEE